MCESCNNRRSALCTSCMPPRDPGSFPSNYSDDVLDPPASEPIVLKRKDSPLTEEDLYTLDLCIRKEIQAIKGRILELEPEVEWCKNHDLLEEVKDFNETIADYKKEITDLTALRAKLMLIP